MNEAAPLNNEHDLFVSNEPTVLWSRWSLSDPSCAIFDECGSLEILNDIKTTFTALCSSKRKTTNDTNNEILSAETSAKLRNTSDFDFYRSHVPQRYAYFLTPVNDSFTSYLSIDEVFPGIFQCSEQLALNRGPLMKLGVRLIVKMNGDLRDPPFQVYEHCSEPTDEDRERLEKLRKVQDGVIKRLQAAGKHEEAKKRNENQYSTTQWAPGFRHRKLHNRAKFFSELARCATDENKLGRPFRLFILTMRADDCDNFDILSHLYTCTNAIELVLRQRRHLELFSHDSSPVNRFTDEDSNSLNFLNPLPSVLVHCLAGVSRSSTVVIAYIMRLLAVSCSEALNFVQFRRPIAQPNRGFLKQLQLWELSAGLTLGGFDQFGVLRKNEKFLLHNCVSPDESNISAIAENIFNSPRGVIPNMRGLFLYCFEGGCYAERERGLVGCLVHALVTHKDASNNILADLLLAFALVAVQKFPFDTDSTTAWQRAVHSCCESFYFFNNVEKVDSEAYFCAAELAVAPRNPRPRRGFLWLMFHVASKNLCSEATISHPFLYKKDAENLFTNCSRAIRLTHFYSNLLLPYVNDVVINGRVEFTCTMRFSILGTIAAIAVQDIQPSELKIWASLRAVQHDSSRSSLVAVALNDFLAFIENALPAIDTNCEVQLLTSISRSITASEIKPPLFQSIPSSEKNKDISNNCLSELVPLWDDFDSAFDAAQQISRLIESSVSNSNFTISDKIAEYKKSVCCTN